MNRGNLIDGKGIAGQIKQELKDEIQRWSANLAHVSGLTVILVGEDPASETYVRGRARDCEASGDPFEIDLKSRIPLEKRSCFLKYTA